MSLVSAKGAKVRLLEGICGALCRLSLLGVVVNFGKGPRFRGERVPSHSAREMICPSGALPR